MIKKIVGKFYSKSYKIDREILNFEAKTQMKFPFESTNKCVQQKELMIKVLTETVGKIKLLLNWSATSNPDEDEVEAQRVEGICLEKDLFKSRMEFRVSCRQLKVLCN